MFTDGKLLPNSTFSQMHLLARFAHLYILQYLSDFDIFHIVHFRSIYCHSSFAFNESFIIFS